MDSDDYIVPEEWNDTEINLFDDLVGGDAFIGDDPQLQEWFDTAMFNSDVSPEEREQAYQHMVEYLWDEYDIDFDQEFDWEDFREWYDTQAA